MFNVSSTCGRNSSQSWRGQSISTVARAAKKCSLNVAMLDGLVVGVLSHSSSGSTTGRE